MSKTFGQFLVEDVVPPHLRSKIRGPLTKKELYRVLYEYAKENPHDAAERMDRLRELGHELAMTEGLSIGLDDISPDYSVREQIIKPALLKIKKAVPEKREKILAETQNKLLDATKKFHGTQAILVSSGARGKPIQLMRSFLAPVAARTSKGEINPWMIHHSYSQGLRPSEMFTANIESRQNQISSNLAVTEPGDFSKILVNNMTDQLVLEEDCGTQNGITSSTDDPNIVDRVLAQPAYGIPAGSIITSEVFNKLRKKKGTVIVRSPMTCEAHEGVCQKCYGLNEYGSFPEIGTNVGVRSAQAITEPLTQFVLSAKHGVRQPGADKLKIEGLAGLRSFLEMPQSFMNKATLSSERGKVSKVEQAPQGGFNVVVNNKEHYVPPGLRILVKKGENVFPGKALSDGIPKPDEVVKYLGLGEGRKYVVSQLHDLYKRQGLDLDKRHFEILAKSHLNQVEIQNDPEGRYFPGELVDYNNFVKRLGQDIEELPLSRAQGKLLAKNYLHHLAGTELTPEVLSDLKKNKFKTVLTIAKPPDISFIVRPITRNPLLNPDWMARLAHRHLKESLLEGVHYAQKTNLHGSHPIPAFVYGLEFGQGPGRRY